MSEMLGYYPEEIKKSEQQPLSFRVEVGDFRDIFAIGHEASGAEDIDPFTLFLQPMLDDENFRQALHKSGSRVLLAVNEAGENIGYIHYLAPDNGERWIKTLFVKPDFRERGVGTTLLNEALAKIEGDGPIHVTPLSKEMVSLLEKNSDLRLK